MYVCNCLYKPFPGLDVYCWSDHEGWLHVPASCPLPTWHCWLPPEQYDARIRSQYIEPKMQGNLARYISHIASLLRLTFYVIIVIAYWYEDEESHVSSTFWRWYGKGQVLTHPNVIHLILSYVSAFCCYIPHVLLKCFCFKRIAFLDPLAYSICIFVCNDVFACFGAVLSTSTQACSRLAGSPPPFHPEMGWNGYVSGCTVSPFPCG